MIPHRRYIILSQEIQIQLQLPIPICNGVNQALSQMITVLSVG